MKREELGKVSVFRFTPGVDAAPRYQEYRVPYRGYTVRNVLRYISENIDSSLSFRWACGQGLCRCCVLSVNDKPVMSCKAIASEYMKIDPHPKFKVMKDLVVDLDKPLY
jgi:succinate dehydrogenase/fumarate reductase iron-sulfur protein